MSRWLDRVKKEGLSLRQTFLIMLIISLSVTALLLYTTFHTLRSFRSLSGATDDYIDMQEAAASLLAASDYLTEEAQSYTVMGTRTHLDNYFRESEETRRREKAIALMESRLPNSEALDKLETAMKDSVHLMDREYYAMRLTLAAQGDTNLPAALQGVELLPEHQALPGTEKRLLAQRMMHDEEYYRQKNMIRADLESCLTELKEGTHGTQRAMEEQMRSDLIWITVLIILQSVGLIFMLRITTKLGINPLLKAVEHIKKDQKIPITGASEFRYLAGTYNKMYSAYRKSIDNLSFKASHDELTQVYNRAGYDLLKQSVDLNTTAVLLFDADQFKEINDHYGHEIGDKVLIKLANTLKKNFRADDYICRIGGDEFVVFMVHVDNDVTGLIERKVVEINRELADTSDGLPPLSVSVGVALGQKDLDAKEVFHEADTALYFVKDHGRNGCCFYHEIATGG